MKTPCYNDDQRGHITHINKKSTLFENIYIYSFSFNHDDQ
jgi:hypothetical protein